MSFLLSFTLNEVPMVDREQGAVGQVQVATSCVPQVWRVKSPAVLQGQLPGTCAGPFLLASCTAQLWGEDRAIWRSRSRFAQVRDADMFVVLGEAGCVHGRVSVASCTHLISGPGLGSLIPLWAACVSWQCSERAADYCLCWWAENLH